MNIFYLAQDPIEAARYAVDRHVVKMIQESGQILSTVHRILDGIPTKVKSSSGKIYDVQLLPSEDIDASTPKPTIKNKVVLNSTHENHPCTIWARESVQNYNWLYAYFEALSNEKSHRYPSGPNITRTQFGKFLKNPPKNIRDIQFTSPALAMPDEYKCYDPVQAYRNYYIGDKYYFAKWTKRSIPEWYLSGLFDVWKSDFHTRIKVISDPKISSQTQINLDLIKNWF